MLDYVVTRVIYSDAKESNRAPGLLTDLRSALVSNNVFGALSVQWRLHIFLQTDSPILARLIAEYALHRATKTDPDNEDEESDSDGDTEVSWRFLTQSINDTLRSTEFRGASRGLVIGGEGGW